MFVIWTKTFTTYLYLYIFYRIEINTVYYTVVDSDGDLVLPAIYAGDIPTAADIHDLLPDSSTVTVAASVSGSVTQRSLLMTASVTSQADFISAVKETWIATHGNTLYIYSPCHPLQFERIYCVAPTSHQRLLSIL